MSAIHFRRSGAHLTGPEATRDSKPPNAAPLMASKASVLTGSLGSQIKAYSYRFGSRRSSAAYAFAVAVSSSSNGLEGSMTK